MKPVNFGIDLGTTNSLIAKYENNRVHIFKNPVGQKETLASVVAYRNDRILVGDKAREYLTKDPINVFGSFKRKMGTNEKFYVVNIDENVTPVELSTLVLKELKNFIHSGETIEACVITIPASFDTMQSNATLEAGLAAGFKDVFLLQEPIAASLTFFNESDNKQQKDGYWLVYDLGGGTFDVALVKSSENELKVVDHEGNNFLGGVDFDFALIDHIIVPAIIAQTGIDNFEEEFRVKHGQYEKLYHEVLYYAEEAKKELSYAPSTEIEFTATLNGKAYDFNIEIQRSDLDRLFAPAINETIKLLKNVLEKNRLTATDIHQIILVGGSTFLPQVREQLAAQTGIPLSFSIDPTTAIATGAAYFAANKYYEPTVVKPSSESIDTSHADELLASLALPEVDVSVELSYKKVSRDSEEVLLLFCSGNTDNKYYRLTRADGGFDTGLTTLKTKKTEFLPLIPEVVNHFTLQVFDEFQTPINSLTQEITITHGKYNIDGQPIPHDICVEVDDYENKTTKLEVIFEKNSLLPQKRTLYREISKTIKKGTKDAIVINILEGDKSARPLSNLTIGSIEISGKDLTTDLVKGSDIEIQFQLSDSRILNAVVYLVMTQQEFKHVFAVSEKQLNIGRLQEQYNLLENELSDTIRQFQYNEEKLWEIKADSLLEELQSIRERLFKLKDKDKSDEKYVIAEKIRRISQEADKLGGNERISVLLESYFHSKELVLTQINSVDFEKEELKKQYQKIEQSEASFISSKNASFIENKLRQLDDLYWKALSNTTSFLITKFIEFKDYEPEAYKDYSAAKSVIKMADTALQNERFPEFRRHVFSLSALLKTFHNNFNTEFKGTGIG